MTSKEASLALSSGYNFHINLPDWKNNSNSAEDIAAINEAKRKRQNLVAFGILVVLVVAIVVFKKK